MAPTPILPADYKSAVNSWAVRKALSWRANNRFGYIWRPGPSKNHGTSATELLELLWAVAAGAHGNSSTDERIKAAFH